MQNEVRGLYAAISDLSDELVAVLDDIPAQDLTQEEKSDLELARADLRSAVDRLTSIKARYQPE